MEKLITKVSDMVVENFGSAGLWIALILLGVALCFIFWERYSKAKNAIADNNFKKFDVFSKILEGDVSTKQPVLIEQAFSNYFGFTLSQPDIQYAFKVTKPTDFILDLKHARPLIKFDENEKKYRPNTLIDLKTKKKIANITFGFFGIVGYVSFGTLIVTKELAWLVPAVLFLFLCVISLHFVRPIYAAIRVCNAYKPRAGTSIIQLQE